MVIAEIRNRNGYCRDQKQERLLQRSETRKVIAEIRNKNCYCRDEKLEQLLQRSEARIVFAKIGNKNYYGKDLKQEWLLLLKNKNAEIRRKNCTTEIIKMKGDI